MFYLDCRECRLHVADDRHWTKYMILNAFTIYFLSYAYTTVNRIPLFDQKSQHTSTQVSVS